MTMDALPPVAAAARERRGVRELCETIWGLERELDLFAWQADGVCAWKLARLDVYTRLAHSLGLLERHEPAPLTLRQELTRKARFALRGVIASPFAGPTGREMLMFPSGRTQGADGRGDVYTAGFTGRLERDCYGIVEAATDLPFGRRPPGTATTHGIEMLARRRPVRPSAAAARAGAAMGAELSDRLRRELGVEVDVAPLLLDRLGRFLSLEPRYRRLFERVRPRRVALVCSYFGKEAIVAAARACGIPVVEIQHGTITPYHLGYSFPGAERIPYFPDVLATFGPYWAETTPIPLPPARVLPLGFAFLSERKRKLEAVPKRPLLLVLSQPVIGAELSRLVVGALPDLDGLEVLYKLHPAERSGWRTRYPWLAREAAAGSVRVVEDGDPAMLHRLLAEAEWQLGVSSTALFEGVAFGCRTIVADLPGTEYMDPLVARGSALRVGSARELAAAIRGGNAPTRPDITGALFAEPPITGEAALCRIDAALESRP